MLFAAFITVVFTFGLYRILVLGLPFYQAALSRAPLVNAACGIMSDAFVMMIFGLVILAGARAKPLPLKLAWVRGVQLFVALAVVAFAAHMRYVEHFGMSFRPFHAAALTTGEVWRVGTKMVFESWRSDLLLGLAAVVYIGVRPLGVRLEAQWSKWPLPQVAMLFAGLLLGAAVADSAMLNLRYQPSMHEELRYNPLHALYFSYHEAEKRHSLPMPRPEELARLRTLLAGRRAYAEGALGQEFPLWQEEVPSGPGRTAELAELRAALQDEAARGQTNGGPWNVVLVISESLRAEELHAWGNEGPKFKGATPELDRLAAMGVRFTEVLGGGLQTHFGQTLAECSVYGSQGFTILHEAPMSNAVCLGDVFARHGYQNFFFYGANNHFDNQEIFYAFHGGAEVHGQNLMPKDAVQGGWGASDRALFKYANEELTKAKKPFFATVLTLTNHPPFKLPGDMPSELVDARLTLEEQLIQYADWSTGRFYNDVLAQFPHTVFVLIADHGKFWHEGLFNQIPSYSVVRRVARIPWLIILPTARAELKGRRVDTVASNTDVAPTLLAILGWLKERQQFMGEDVFSREGPVYIDWLGKLLAIDQNKIVSAVPDDLAELIGAAGRYNLLAPAEHR